MKKGIGPRQLGSPLKQTMSDRAKLKYKQEESKFEETGRKGGSTRYSTKDFKDPNVTIQPPTQEGKIGSGWASDPNWQADYGKGAEWVAFNEKTGQIGAVKRTTVKKPLGRTEEYREVEWDRRPKAGTIELPKKKGRILKK